MKTLSEYRKFKRPFPRAACAPRCRAPRPRARAAGRGQDGGLGTGRRRGWGCSGRTAERCLQTDANVLSAAD